MFLVLLSGLEAYNVFGIPLTWISQIGFVGVFGWIWAQYGIERVPGLVLLWLFVGWAALVTSTNIIATGHGAMMPTISTTSYWPFLTLRFISYISAGCAITTFYWLFRQRQVERVLAQVVQIAGVFAAFALYIYCAERYGWWEPLRNRLGTNGLQATAEWTYAFKRALGTFREPSHMAEWLTAPALLTFCVRSRFRAVLRTTMFAAILLSGSLTALVATPVSVFLSFIAGGMRARALMRGLLGIVICFALAYTAFTSLVAFQTASFTSIGEVLADRIDPIVEMGPAGSNRGYIYDYIKASPPSFLGVGLGQSNLDLSTFLGTQVVASFLSLFYNATYSTGYFGVCLLLIMLGLPAIRRYKNDRERGAWVTGAYIFWLIAFGVRAEEFTVMFSLVFALQVYLQEQPLHCPVRMSSTRMSSVRRPSVPEVVPLADH